MESVARQHLSLCRSGCGAAETTTAGRRHHQSTSEQTAQRCSNAKATRQLAAAITTRRPVTVHSPTTLCIQCQHDPLSKSAKVGRHASSSNGMRQSAVMSNSQLASAAVPAANTATGSLFGWAATASIPPGCLPASVAGVCWSPAQHAA